MKKEEIAIQIQKIEKKTIRVKLIGDTPLIMHTSEQMQKPQGNNSRGCIKQLD